MTKADEKHLTYAQALKLYYWRILFYQLLFLAGAVGMADTVFFAFKDELSLTIIKLVISIFFMCLASVKENKWLRKQQEAITIAEVEEIARIEKTWQEGVDLDP